MTRLDNDYFHWRQNYLMIFKENIYKVLKA